MIDMPGVFTIVFSALVNLLVYVLIKRSIEKNDDEFKALRTEVKEHQAARLNKIEGDIVHGTQGRKMLWDAVDSVKETYVRKQDCFAEHMGLEKKVDSFSQTVVKLESVGTKTDAAIDRIESISLQLMQTQKDVAAVCERIKDVRPG